MNDRHFRQSRIGRNTVTVFGGRRQRGFGSQTVPAKPYTKSSGSRTCSGDAQQFDQRVSTVQRIFVVLHEDPTLSLDPARSDFHAIGFLRCS